MKIKTGIQLAKLATTLGWIEKKDWKTPKILFVGYRKTVTKKAINNATKAGYSFIKYLVNKVN